MNPFKNKKDKLLTLEALKPVKIVRKELDINENLFFKCQKCSKSMLKDEIISNDFVCIHCNYHHTFNSILRINSVIDAKTFRKFSYKINHKNFIDFDGYLEKIDVLKQKTGLLDAVTTGVGEIYGKKVCIAVMDTRFLMGSMGTVVGEVLTRLIEYATVKKLPLVIFSASGGARMQEGIFSLMQMAKTAQAIKKHSKANLLYISVLTNPTTGGVTASFASLGDIIISEPGALIGFAGPRVIEQTIKQKLPEGFQTAEYLLENGFLDAVVNRCDMKETIGKYLKFFS